MSKAIKSHTIQIYNSSKQMIPLTVSPPGGDFFQHSQTIYLQRGKKVSLPKSHINEKQLNNLTKGRMIRILSDTEKQQTD